MSPQGGHDVRDPIAHHFVANRGDLAGATEQSRVIGRQDQSFLGHPDFFKRLLQRIAKIVLGQRCGGGTVAVVSGHGQSVWNVE